MSSRGFGPGYAINEVFKYGFEKGARGFLLLGLGAKLVFTALSALLLFGHELLVPHASLFGAKRDVFGYGWRLLCYRRLFGAFKGLVQVAK